MDALVHELHPAKQISYKNDYKLRLVSKKLSSGRCQVKFFAKLPGKRELYGYVLAEAHDTLKGVVENIVMTLRNVRSHSDFRHKHLYTIQKVDRMYENIIIFDT